MSEHSVSEHGVSEQPLEPQAGPTMNGIRLGLIGLGVVAGLWGAVHLLQTGVHNLLSAVWWLAGGVIVHDFLLSPLVVGLAIAVAGVVRHHRIRPPVIGGLIVLATVSVVAVPVLGRFGARPDNPTLLPRDYTGGWLVFLGVVVLGVLLSTLVDLVRGSRRTQPGQSAGPVDSASTDAINDSAS